MDGPHVIAGQAFRTGPGMAKMGESTPRAIETVEAATVGTDPENPFLIHV